MLKNSELLYDRLVNNEKRFEYYQKKYKMSKDEFERKLKSIFKCKEFFPDDFIVKSHKIFESKVNNDIEKYKWNKENPNKRQKQYSFSYYCILDENGKVKKDDKKFPVFFEDLKNQYNSQQKSNLEKDLNWVTKSSYLVSNDHICYNCGVSEKILLSLYNDSNYTCKSKRNRGSWFEIDRKSSNQNENVYSRENIVLCCYFCNNHKSDVISSDDMRLFFGEKMFEFLIMQYNKLQQNQ
jgi:hypothetical protein